MLPEPDTSHESKNIIEPRNLTDKFIVQTLKNLLEVSEISIDDYLSLKDGEEASIIYIARPTCSFCQQEEPIIEEIVSEYGVTVNYLNTDNLNNDGLTDLVQSDEYFSEGFGTPLLMVVEKNEIKEVLEGLKDKDTIVDFFKKYGFISE